MALEHVPLLDLSGTEWPEFPDAEVVSASVYTARGRMNGYPDSHATRVRRALAERHYIKAARSCSATAPASCCRRPPTCCSRDGEELVVPVAELLALSGDRAACRRRGRCRSTLADGVLDSRALLAADRRAHARADALQPERPDRHVHRARRRSASCSSRLPEHVHVLLDEAYIQFQDVEERGRVR